eukprot:TRINITY_DN28153_c0_g1_i1.p3 TRINITY_DN28153_c0_g1~~TRINITY_DN28153_c0_g1_i1.p3  ORF type:complete len:103 (-),score=11.53 TRINITY_DN28153_c0_g1_i1:119-382(-)
MCIRDRLTSITKIKQLVLKKNQQMSKLHPTESPSVINGHGLFEQFLGIISQITDDNSFSTCARESITYPGLILACLLYTSPSPRDQA